MLAVYILQLPAVTVGKRSGFTVGKPRTWKDVLGKTALQAAEMAGEIRTCPSGSMSDCATHGMHFRHSRAAGWHKSPSECTQEAMTHCSALD